MPRPMPPVPRPPSTTTAPEGPVLVLTADPVLERHLLSVVAAVGLAPDQPAGDDLLRRSWRSAAAVLVGRDQAERIGGLALPPRPQVYLVGRDDDRPETDAWSARLRATPASVPGGAGALAAALSGLAGLTGRGTVVALTGATGGTGTSTLAAALAFTGAREGLRSLLLDADETGGGIDVLLGAEQLPGWRWDRFGEARGHLGDLGEVLLHCDGVDVLAVDRGRDPEAGLGAEQMAAVLDAAARTNDLTVVDLPRHRGAAHDEVLRRAGRVLLVVRADVRGVAAADQAARALVRRCGVVEVVVRTGPGHGLDPGLVADALDLPLAGVVEEDASVRGALERGDPPGRSGRSSLAHLCVDLLSEQTEAVA